MEAAPFMTRESTEMSREVSEYAGSFKHTIALELTSTPVLITAVAPNVIELSASTVTDVSASMMMSVALMPELDATWMTGATRESEAAA
jgi:hypothetical protein